jgi:predicted nucleic acid-binding protein
VADEYIFTSVAGIRGQVKGPLEDSGQNPKDVDGFLDYLLSVATRRNIFFTWRPHLSDPDDEMVLDLAVASGAPYIVTFNVKDFRRGRTLGRNPVTPGEFLRILEKSQ